MQVSGSASLGFNVFEDAFYLLDRDAYSSCSVLSLHLMIERIKAQIHPVIRQCKVKLLLCLRHRKSVSGGWALPDFFWHAKVLCQLVHLGFVKVGNRFEVRRAVTLLHEKTLVIFQQVGCARYRIVKSVCVVVLGHLAHALLEVSRSNHLQVSTA